MQVARQVGVDGRGVEPAEQDDRVPGGLGGGRVDRVERVVHIVPGIHARYAQVLEEASVLHGGRRHRLHGRDARSPEEPALQEHRLLDVDAAEQEQVLRGERVLGDRGQVGGPKQGAHDEQVEGRAQHDHDAQQRGQRPLHATDGTREAALARSDLVQGIFGNAKWNVAP